MTFAVFVAIMLLGQVATVSASSSFYLAVSARSAEGFSSVRKLGVFYDEPYIAVMGGEPFTIEIECSYPVEPARVYLAVSDGAIHEIANFELDYSCTNLVRYYGLILAVFPSGTVEASSFWMKPSWRIEDEEFVPEERPLPAKPVIEDDTLQALIDDWWEATVIPMENQFK